MRNTDRRFFATLVLFIGLPAAAALVGCGASETEVAGVTTTSLDSSEGDVGSASSQGSLDASKVLSAMPEGEPKTPTDVKETEQGSEAIVLAGRIDADDMDPFQEGKLAFMISQLPDDGHGADDPDHADNCPFCKRKLKNAPKAIVQFLGSDGAVLDGNARSVLGIERGDIVYVTGNAVYNSAVNTVMVDATGVFRKSL